MSLTLDSNVVINILRGDKQGFRQRIDAALAAGLTIHVSAVVYYELVFGALLSLRPELQLQKLDAVVGAFQLEPWTVDEAQAAAKARLQLQIPGTPIGLLDTLIAGHALARGHTLVTGNLRHFERVEGLRLVDWSLSAEPD